MWKCCRGDRRYSCIGERHLRRWASCPGAEGPAMVRSAGPLGFLERDEENCG